MKREILFRGKRVDGDGWVEGYYFFHVGRNTHIILCNDRFIQIDPATVGQFTGLTDKNGKKIFEGDVVKSIMCNGVSYIGAVTWHFHGWFIWDYPLSPNCEVIRNIHDNPDLL